MKTNTIHHKWIYRGVIAILLYLLFTAYRRPPKMITTTQTKTDTIYVDRPYKEIVIKEVIKPQKVYVYKRDTVFREKIIKDTLFTGLSLTNEKASIHSITPMGITNINTYDLPPFESLTIDYEGKLAITPKKEKKGKKTWNTIKYVGIFIGGVFIGSKLNK